MAMTTKTKTPKGKPVTKKAKGERRAGCFVPVGKAKPVNQPKPKPKPRNKK